jgi:PAS domain S-box-containing protein
MKQSLEKRIILFSFVILSLTILANTGMDIAVFRKDYIQEMLLRSQSMGNALKGNIEKVLALGIDIKDVAGLTEKCKEVVQSDPEMAYCVITGGDGKPLFASESGFAAFDFAQNGAPASEADTKQLKTATIKTARGIYYNTVTSIRSYDGRTVAFVYIGFPQSAIDQKVHAIILRSIVVLLVFFLVSFALVVFFVKRSIITPVSSLLEGVTRISQGNFKTTIRELPVYELNELGAKINAMSTALETRDSELRKNYEELSATHSQLHTSYMQLEKLSLDLEKSEDMYKKLLEEAGDAIIILDRNEIIIIANKMAEDFLGYPAAEIVNQHISTLLLLLKAENISQLLTTFHDAYDGVYVSTELTITNSSQEQLIGRIHASCVTMGDSSLLQVIIRDVTKEREILANLEKSASGLARLNKMKDSFLGLASHELKTPLTVIMGYAELLLTDMKDQLNETTAEMVQNISGAASRLDGIVKDMIDVSMIDQKQIELNRDNVDVNTLIETAIKELRFFFALRKQEITTHLDASLPLLKGDQNRLLQLLSNILGNAIKFTPDNGKITVTTSVRHIMCGKNTPSFSNIWSLNIGKDYQSYVEIIISDTGIGIDKDDQLRIFDKFYEAGNIEEHSSGKVAFKSRGAGLGLSIAKGIVEMHGGQVWVESTGYDPVSCPGSTFFILLPLDPSHYMDDDIVPLAS